jgi:serine phosphatase RsbU (regulator of sigma subunit)
MFFGGIEGFNAFFPQQITDNPYVPPVVITSFQKLNKKVIFDRPIFDIDTLNLSYKDYIISFEFAALDFTAPEKNLYAYKMENLDEDWIYSSAKKRYATYTTLSPGSYVFRVKGSNNDGIWNEKGTAIVLNIKPPFWQTWLFRAVMMLVILGLVYHIYQKRLKNVRLKIELQAAHDAQMSIMPQTDPLIDGFDISGICIPANNVGGDFFDYFWLDEDNNRFGFAIGDVSGKAMGSAMTAIMTTGMIYSKIGSGSTAIKDIMTQLNRPLFVKTDRKMFIAVSLVSLDVKSKILTFTNAGLSEPLLKSGNNVISVPGNGLKHPLGLLKNTVYQEKQVQLKDGDIFIFLTDGILEAQNHIRELYGETRIKKLLQHLDTKYMSANELKIKIVKDIRQFSGNSPQHDDMTLIVVKCL